MSLIKNIIFAPNVHTGGGLELLKPLLMLSSRVKVGFVLDERARSKMSGFIQENAAFFNPTIIGRFKAELELFNYRGADEVLCFHNLPPLLPFNGRISVFFQNVNILDSSGLVGGNIRVYIRSLLERSIFKIFRGRVNRFYVQTPSVKQLLVEKGEISPDKIIVFPFNTQNKVSNSERQGDRDGFVYVADGISHKNHFNLIEAWSLLSRQGYYPELKLTLGECDALLWSKLKLIINEQGLNVVNVGHLSFSEIETLYKSSEALIFPSLKESFGLPLIEAGSYGLPVIAPELDYVRDVCRPVETFNPLSARSIEQAVRRFKGWGDDRVNMSNPEEFLHQVFHN